MSAVNSAELALAQELVELLTQMELIKDEIEKAVAAHNDLDGRRLEILTSLHDGAEKKLKPSKTKTTKRSDPSPTDPLSNYNEFDRALSRGEVPVTPGVIAALTAPALAGDAPDKEAIRSNLDALHALEGQPVRTVELTPEQAEAQRKAIELYEAGIEKRSDAQMRMVFALLGNHDIRNEAEQKDVIWGIIAEQHHGETLSSTSELSKVWATDLIGFLNTAKSGELNKFLKEPFPS